MESNSKSKYRALCNTDHKIPVFAQAYYLDAISEQNWDVIEARHKSGASAYLPYFLKSKFGLKSINMPTYFPYSCITYNNIPESREKASKAKRHLHNELFSNFPKQQYLRIFMDPSYVDGMSIYFGGHMISHRYTYILDNIKDHEKIFAGYSSNVRNHIRKSEDFILQTDKIEIGEFHTLLDLVFSRQKLENPYDSETLARVDEPLSSRGKRTILSLENKAGKTIAATYLIHDGSTSYCLLTATDPMERNHQPLSRLYNESIKYASRSSDQFDFLGSNIPQIERMIRDFGGTQTPYITLSKTNLLFKLLKNI